MNLVRSVIFNFGRTLRVFLWVNMMKFLKEKIISFRFVFQEKKGNRTDLERFEYRILRRV